MMSTARGIEGEDREKKRHSANNSSFTCAMALTKLGDPNIPEKYVLPPSQRPSPTLTASHPLAFIDLSWLHDPASRPHIVNQVSMACRDIGFFQVINHGISTLLMNDALDAASKFFDLPADEKMHLMSENVHEPVRYGTSMNHTKDKVYFWRDFIKHYSHPLSKWIDMWPSNPSCYKETMGNYAKAVQKLQKQLIELVFESAGLNCNYLREDIEEGSQVLVVNCYPACPEPNLTLGMPPHTDYGALTIINQNEQGLEITDKDNKWYSVPVINGSLIVQLGDQMEIISNGMYKSLMHRVTVNSEKNRVSIASIHSMALDKKVAPAPELVNEQHPVSYKEGSFREFLDFISENDPTEGRYIETLKKNA